MNRICVWIHRALIAVSALLLLGSLVFYLSRWSSLPVEAGIHFGPDGNFDVYESRFYGFYPHLIGGLIVGGLTFSGLVIRKKHTGLRIRPEGERLFKTELLFTLDAIALLISCFFTYWSRCVALQVPMQLGMIRTLLSLIFLCAAAGIILQVITCLLHREKTAPSKNPGLRHRLCRLIAWLFTAASWGVLAVSLERLPSAPEAHESMPGSFYLANFNTYADKWVLLAVYGAGLLLMILCEALTVRAGKRRDTTLVTLLDRCKAILGTGFFWWTLLLISESPIGPVSVILFTALLALSIGAYIRSRHRQPDADNKE